MDNCNNIEVTIHDPYLIKVCTNPFLYTKNTNLIKGEEYECRKTMNTTFKTLLEIKVGRVWEIHDSKKFKE